MIAWYPPSHTFVCSAIEELNLHFLSTISSGKVAGLQNCWQCKSVSLCFVRKWRTSTGFAVSWKCFHWLSLAKLAAVQNRWWLSVVHHSAINSSFNSASDPEVGEISDGLFLWEKMILNHIKWQLRVFPPLWTLNKTSLVDPPPLPTLAHVH